MSIKTDFLQIPLNQANLASNRRSRTFSGDSATHLKLVSEIASMSLDASRNQVDKLISESELDGSKEKFKTAYSLFDQAEIHHRIATQVRNALKELSECNPKYDATSDLVFITSHTKLAQETARNAMREATRIGIEILEANERKRLCDIIRQCVKFITDTDKLSKAVVGNDSMRADKQTRITQLLVRAHHVATEIHHRCTNYLNQLSKLSSSAANPTAFREAIRKTEPSFEVEDESVFKADSGLEKISTLSHIEELIRDISDEVAHPGDTPTSPAPST